MMYATRSRQAGFTAIETIVSVFVATLFMISLISLFTSFNYFSAGARQLSVADNLAYNYLQKYTNPSNPSSGWFTCDDANDRSTNPAATGTQIDGGTLDADAVKLPSPAKYTITALAPYGCSDASQTFPVLVDVAVTYGLNSRVTHHSAYAIYNCKSLSDNSGCINTLGLIGWWPLDGDADDYFGNYNGTVYGATTTAGQDDLDEHAYSFNGTNNYIDFGNPTAFNLPRLTMSTWMKRSNGSPGGQIFGKEFGYKIGIMSINSARALVSRDGTAWDQDVNATYAPTFVDETWYNVAMTVDSSTATTSVYVNGNKILSQNNLGGPITQYNTVSLIAGAFNPGHGGWFKGSIDDLRLYDRVLSDKELKSIYNAGAQ